MRSILPALLGMAAMTQFGMSNSDDYNDKDYVYDRSKYGLKKPKKEKHSNC